MNCNISVCVPYGVLNYEDSKKLEFITDKSVLNTLKKVKKFWKDISKEEKKELIKLSSKVCLESITDPYFLTTNAWMGLIFLAANFMPPKISIPVKITSLAVSGLMVAGGIVYIVHTTKREVVNSDIYLNWENNLNEEKLKLFNKVIKNDESFNRFICKISNTFINTAVMAPNNLLYEKDLIEMWLDAKEKEIKEAIESGASSETIEEMKKFVCPVRGKYFTKDQLVPYENYHSELEKLVLEKIKNREKYLEIQLINDGLRALLSTCESNRDNVFCQKLAAIELFCLKNNLPDRIASHATNYLKKEYKTNYKKIYSIK